jgi:hypothetical protein
MVHCTTHGWLAMRDVTSLSAVSRDAVTATLISPSLTSLTTHPLTVKVKVDGWTKVTG